MENTALETRSLQRADDTKDDTVPSVAELIERWRVIRRQQTDEIIRLINEIQQKAE